MKKKTDSLDTLVTGILDHEGDIGDKLSMELFDGFFTSGVSDRSKINIGESIREAIKENVLSERNIMTFYAKKNN